MRISFNRIFGALIFASASIFAVVATRSPVETHETSASREIASEKFAQFSAYAGLHESCRESNECAGRMLCLHGWCAEPDRNNRGSAGDSCSGPASGALECLSGVCGADGLCAPSVKDRADNDLACDEAAAFVCRSGVCRGGRCAPSPRFPGLPGESCVSPADCASNICEDLGSGEKECGFAAGVQTACAWVGDQVNSPAECCSKATDSNGRCSPVEDLHCTIDGNCALSVGRTCADVGAMVVSSTQCCSGRMSGGRCVMNPNSDVQPCRLNRACRSGYCDEKTKLCDVPGGVSKRSRRSDSSN